MWKKYVDIHKICIIVSDSQRGLEGDEIMLAQFKRQLYDHIGPLFDSSNTNECCSYDIYKRKEHYWGGGWKLCQDENFFTKPPAANAPFSIEF